MKEFSYLGSQLNQTNSTNSEIQIRILSGNRYSAYEKLTFSHWDLNGYSQPSCTTFFSLGI